MNEVAVGNHPRYARVKVVDGPLTSFPIVERVFSGWQSGVMFYPDSLVESVAPLHVIPAEWGIEYRGIHTYESEAEARRQLVFAQADVPAKLVHLVDGEWVVTE